MKMAARLVVHLVEGADGAVCPDAAGWARRRYAVRLAGAAFDSRRSSSRFEQKDEAIPWVLDGRTHDYPGGPAGVWRPPSVVPLLLWRELRKRWTCRYLRRLRLLYSPYSWVYGSIGDLRSARYCCRIGDMYPRSTTKRGAATLVL